MTRLHMGSPIMCPLWPQMSGPRRCCRPQMINCSLTHAALVALLVTLLWTPGTQGYAVCRYTFRCANGGVERYGQDIFSPCRCICPVGYTGPRCQYRHITTKRSAFNVLADFLHNSLSQQQSPPPTNHRQNLSPQQQPLANPEQEAARNWQSESRDARRHPRFFFRR